MTRAHDGVLQPPELLVEFRLGHSWLGPHRHAWLRPSQPRLVATESATLAGDGWRQLGQGGGKRSSQAGVALEQGDVRADDPIAQPALQLLELSRRSTGAANGGFSVGRELASCNRQLATQRLAHDEAGAAYRPVLHR